jgi:hypothetical protein
MYLVVSGICLEKAILNGQLEAPLFIAARAFGEALPAGTRLTLFSNDKPERFFTVIQFRMDETSGVALALKTGVPSYQIEDEEGRTHLLIHLPIEEEDVDRWCLWRPDHAVFDSRSIFEGALVEG